jgi:hypothetical protein
MTEPTPTPEKQKATPDSEAARQDENSSTPERDGFFRRVRREPHKPIHPSETEEIVVDIEGDGDR